jgi:hypothetical protein
MVDRRRKPPDIGFAVKMPVLSFTRDSFFDPEFAMPRSLEPGTLPWLLGYHRDLLFPPWLLRGWRGESNHGRSAWPAQVLMTLLLLRWSESGMSRLGSVKRAESDVRWRAALGLEIGGPTPSEKTLREFEAFLRGRHPDCDMPRYMVFFEHCVRLCMDNGVLARPPNWAMDSTPMWCYGAVKDTVRLLGDGVAQLARAWSKASGVPVGHLAQSWRLPHLLAKSTKGAFRIDWRDRQARADVVHGRAQGVVTATATVRDCIHHVARSKRKRLLRLCRHLVRVIVQDLEKDAQGRLVVAQRVAKDRLISITDPQARHGHKSRKRSFDGFKLHALGDVVSGLIASLTVTSGNVHDGAVAHRLVRRAKGLQSDIERVMGDSAYGGATLRHEVRVQQQVTLLAPSLESTAARGKLGRGAVHIDFAARQATCAAGVTVGQPRRVTSREHQRETWAYRWPSKVCKGCPQREPCNGKRAEGHRIVLHPHEDELRAARAAWQDPEVREAYRTRSQCERLMSRSVQHGARQVRTWGLAAAHMQAHAIAAACNLALLAKALAKALAEREQRPLALAA